METWKNEQNTVDVKLNTKLCFFYFIIFAIRKFFSSYETIVNIAHQMKQKNFYMIEKQFKRQEKYK